MRDALKADLRFVYDIFDICDNQSIVNQQNS